MELIAIIVAVVGALLVLKFIKGMIKFALLAVLILGALYFAGVFN